MAVGLTLIFGVLKIPNFSHGEFVMIGMYIVFLLYQSLGLSPYIASLIVAIILFLFGIGFERVLVRPILRAGEMPQVFMTVGLSFFLSNLCFVVFKAEYRHVPTPFSSSSYSLGPFYLPTPPFFAFCAAVVTMAILHWFLRGTYYGKVIRAVSVDRQTARLMGINVDLVYAMTVGLALALTGISASLLATLFPIFPDVGTYFVLIAFVVVVLGGFGSVAGAMIGGVAIGVIESLSGYYIGQGWNQAVYFAAFLAVLILRPQGLFGKSV
jgi:branched-chain amino acid transport system permease protein